MFWNNLIELCNQRKTTPTTVVKKLKISGASVTKWKNGSIPRDTTLKKIADYFAVTIDDLLSEEEKKTVHVDEQEQGSLSAEEKILLLAFNRASADDCRVLWTLLDKYMTPNEKQYISQSRQ